MHTEQRRNGEGRRHLARLLIGPMALLGGTTLGLAVTGVTAPAAVAAPYGPACTVTTSSSTVAAGGPITVGGNCGTAGDSITFTLGGTTLGTVTAGPGGAYSATFTVPSSLAPGTYTLTARDATSGETASTTVTVTAASTGAGGGTGTGPGGGTGTGTSGTGTSGTGTSGTGTSGTGTTPFGTGTSGTGTSGGLAFTGTDAALTSGIGAAAIGAGGLLVLSSRKRRQRGFQS